MIQFDLHEYCDDCPNFRAYSRKDALYAGNEIFHITHTIMCENREQCDYLKNHIDKNIGKMEKQE